jgi:hypothetical protein
MESLARRRDDSIRHHRRKPLRGESLGSMMAGCPSLVIGLLNLVALVGLPPAGTYDMVRRGMVRVSKGVPGSSPLILKYAWWYVPQGLFWVQNCCGLALAAAGNLLTYRKSRPLMSMVGFTVNALAAVLGYVFTMIDAGEG